MHVEEEEEHDYESLPVGAGWGVNMAAGAMVCYFWFSSCPSDSGNRHTPNNPTTGEFDGEMLTFRLVSPNIQLFSRLTV